MGGGGVLTEEGRKGRRSFDFLSVLRLPLFLSFSSLHGHVFRFLPPCLLALLGSESVVMLVDQRNTGYVVIAIVIVLPRFSRCESWRRAKIDKQGMCSRQRWRFHHIGEDVKKIFQSDERKRRSSQVLCRLYLILELVTVRHALGTKTR